MKQLDRIQKLSVLHCVYQQIASADGNIQEERDENAISLALDTLGLSIYDWRLGMQQNPHDSFFHLQVMSPDQKEQFRQLLLQIAEMGGHRQFRLTCAEHLFQLCGM